ncbi:sensor histidine kinase [Streptomyces rubellomurinus]|uniref:sensor histidine kinase n=1 Tax=Streptomyces rubellomurinus (strain ATCC 31215) TaxID=359131 RepID=UPI0005F267F1|nr:histidine kinase [Streptomyces rubellomurinus]
MTTGESSRLRRATAALVGHKALLRWVHLVLGGALLMPYWMLSVVLLGGFGQGDGLLYQVVVLLGSLFTSLPMAGITALVPIVRGLEGAAARALCAVERPEELAGGPSQSWAARRRTALWYMLHVFLGGVVAGLTLGGGTGAIALIISEADDTTPWAGSSTGRLLAGPAVGLGLILLIVLISAGSGALLARCAPVLLGPTPEERLAAAERRATVLAQRNRLARELHDSVGHALSAVGIQASAAARVLRSDPDFAAEALHAIEETARAAVAELDTVLGLLREESPETAEPAGPTLAGLDDLLRQLARTGVTVDADLSPGLRALPAEVSREAYRIVQEGLTNVLRHAGPAPAGLRVAVTGSRLEIELTNPLGPTRPSRPGGGRGLRGIDERATALRGGSAAGPDDDGTTWRLAVWLPVGGTA